VTGDWSRKKGANPFFYVYWVPKRGHRVKLRENLTLAAFRSLIASDPGYRRRLLLATDDWPEREDRYEVCAEQPYNGSRLDQNRRRCLAH
jgi:hypothetical protein